MTSWSTAAANAFGLPLVPHDKRYEIAEEYMDVTYKLWNGSWADDSVRWDEKTKVAYEPSRIKKIEHNGDYPDPRRETIADAASQVLI